MAHRDQALHHLLRVGRDVIVLAPMVRGSELAFRMLVRSHGVSVCYTPMLKADQVLKGSPEERHLVEECREALDRPLIVQLAGREPGLLAAAVRAVREAFEPDGFDLNLGCPQECARDGRYGAFLQEEPELAVACVRAMCAAADPVPVYCKTRIFDSVVKSVEFARALEEAGCALLAVHGRLREAKLGGEPDFSQLSAIVAALNIPVVANGAISSRLEARALLTATGAAGVMLGTALLTCPRLLSAEAGGCDAAPPPRGALRAPLMALEYLDFAERYPPPSPLYLRKHLRWIFRAELEAAYTAARAQWLEGAELGCADWRVRAWTFLEQPHLAEIWQFRELTRLIAEHLDQPVDSMPALGFAQIRCRRGRSVPNAEEDMDMEEADYSSSWLFDPEPPG